MSVQKNITPQAEIESALPFWRQIRWNLVLAFAILTILPVALVVPLILSWLSAQTGEQVINQLESVAELKQSQLTRWLNDSSFAMDVFLADPETRNNLIAFSAATLNNTFASSSAEANPYNQQLTRLVRSEPFFEEFFVYNANGQVVASSNPVQIGKIITRQPYFAQGLAQPTIQAPYYEVDVQGGKLTIIVTRPLLNSGTGQAVAALAGRLDLSILGQIMTDRTGLGESGETYLVSLQNNYLLTPSRFEGYPLTRAYRSQGIDNVLNGQNGAGLYENYFEPPVPVFGVYRWIPQLQAGLVAEVSQAEALTPFARVRNFSVALGVLAVLVAVAVGFYSARRISNPITILTRAATQITGGNLDQRVDIPQQNEIGLLAQAFNTMTERLRLFIDTLEERVSERTRALETSAEISRQINGILDLNEVLKQVVNRIQVEFEFYHTHIYLLDETGEELVMAEGSGEVGQQLKAKGHRLAVGRGIVGTVAATSQALMSNNVDEIPNFVRNPLLPNTQSELAVPLRKGDKLLGVLDIQSEQQNRFTTVDMELMQALANQIAVAIDNARLVSQTQAALQEVERLNRRLTGESWQKFIQQKQTAGYRYRRGASMAITPDSDIWLSPMKQALTKKQLVKQSRPGNGQPSEAELAVPLILRGEVIGVLGVKREKTLDWAEEEVSAVEAVADQLTRALENARLSEEQEKTIEQLKEVDRLKSEFLTSMSHELRTPLNSIIGFADVLLQGIDGDLNDMALNDIRLIYNSGQHLLALINDILDISKIEAGMMELVREPLDMKEIVYDVLAASNSLVKDKPVKIVIDVADNLPPVFADKLRLNQVLLNLASNAAKFTHQGSITIQANLNEEMPDKMRIAIIDTGIGIAPDKINTIFDRFRQADSSTTRQYGGTGLGLAICKQLVEMHGGELKVASQVGQGSEFYFSIPLVETITLQR